MWGRGYSRERSGGDGIFRTDLSNYILHNPSLSNNSIFSAIYDANSIGSCPTRCSFGRFHPTKNVVGNVG